MTAPTPDPAMIRTYLAVIDQDAKRLERSKHDLATYLSNHAPSRCEYDAANPCIARADGVLILSCGHATAMCAEHASMVLRAVQGVEDGRKIVGCSQSEPRVHDLPALDVKLEWRSIA